MSQPIMSVGDLQECHLCQGLPRDILTDSHAKVGTRLVRLALKFLRRCCCSWIRMCLSDVWPSLQTSTLFQETTKSERNRSSIQLGTFTKHDRSLSGHRSMPYTVCRVCDQHPFLWTGDSTLKIPVQHACNHKHEATVDI